MAYRGSEAYVLEETAYELEPRSSRQDVSHLQTVRGGRLDSEAARSVSRVFWTRAKLVTITLLTIFALGAVRVALTVATVSTLSATTSMKAQLTEAQDTNDQLRISHSILSSESRISRIATQNYGMSYDSDRETINLSGDTAEVSAAH